MRPPEWVRVAAGLGCVSVSTSMKRGIAFNPDDQPDWSLRADPALVRELAATCRETGVALALVEGFFVAPDRDVAALAGDLDIAAEAGAERIACISIDQDLSRTVDQFAALAGMAAERGLRATAEIGSMGPYGRADKAGEVFARVGHGGFTMMLDAMHWFRLGNTVDDLAALPTGAIGYVQLCDAPMADRFDTYMEEAMYERMVPGEGELPLEAMLDVLPRDVPVSLEVPLRSRAMAGEDAAERLAPCVAAARALLAGRS